MESPPIKDEKILGQFRTFQRPIQEVKEIYGAIPNCVPTNTGAKVFKIVNGGV